MRRLLTVLAAAMLSLPALAPAASAARERPFVYSNVSIYNDQIGAFVQFHGLGNLVTVGTSASSMSQSDCQDASWLGQGTVPVCEWHNGSGLCFGASKPDAEVRAEVCNGSSAQLWWTTRSGDTVNAWYILNLHWSGVDGQDQFAIPLSGSVGADISAAGSSSSLAVWLI